MTTDNVTVVSNSTTVQVTQVPATSLTVTQQGPINVTIGTAGVQGATGPAPTLLTPTTITGAAGSNAAVTISGTPIAGYTLAFTIPRGNTGATGPAPTLNTPTVTALAIGSTPTVGITGTNPYTINFGIPLGAAWSNGSAAPIGTTPGNVGDYYLVTGATGLGDVYKKTAASTWTLQGNIRGAAGSGTVNSVNSVTPDGTGNVALTQSNSGLRQAVLTRGTNTIYQDVLTIGYGGTSATNTGSIVIQTNIPTTSGAMIRVDIQGTLYTVGNFNGSLTMYLYNNAGGTLHSPIWNNTGDVTVTCRVAKNASNNLVIILDTPAGGWNYPRITVERVMSSVANSTYFTGWTESITTDLSALNTITNMTSSKDSLTENVILSGAQTITGIKTFPGLTLNNRTGADNSIGFSGGNLYLEASAGNNIYLRPNGAGSNTGLFTVSTSGFNSSGTGNSIISGAISVGAASTIDGGGSVLNLKPGSADHAYIAFFARTATPAGRTGYFGFAAGGTTTLTVNNEISGGNLDLRTSGNGTIFLNAGSGIVNAVAGQLQESGQRVYSPNNKPTDASSFTTGTLPDARLSTNVMLLTGAQTITGLKTFNVVPGSSATPLAIDMGNGYGSNAAGDPNNIKFRLYASGSTAYYGFGVSTARLEYHAYQSGGKHTFYTFGTEVLNLATGAATVTGTLTATSFSGSGASLTSLTAANISGVIPIANIPTGTTGTTVALGNHLHTGTYEPVLAAGTISQFYRGDKTWATLDKAAVGLSNVTNVAQEPAITAGTTAQYWRGDKSWQTLNAAAVGLANVANLAQVDLVNAQTIGGIKTFSATPVFSSGISVTGTATATTFSGSGASLTSLNASNISSGTVPQANMKQNVQRFVFTAATDARPTGSTYVEWVGPVQPNNAIDGDTWVNTA